MSKRTWPPYPPCISGQCTDSACCAQGHKFRWPEVVGKTGQQAAAIIKKENPMSTVVLLPQGKVQLTDFCCNRIYVLLDASNKVYAPPIVG